jgi:hypothetical protein
MSSKSRNVDVNTNNEKTEIIKLLESNLVFLDKIRIRLKKDLLKIRQEKNKILKEIESERIDRAEIEAMLEASEKEKLEIKRLEKERLVRIAYFTKKEEVEQATIAERRERQKIAATKSGGGDGFNSRGKRQSREENDRSDDENHEDDEHEDEEQKDTKRRC